MVVVTNAGIGNELAPIGFTAPFAYSGIIPSP